MDIATFAQTLFYFVSSIAILIVGALVAVAVYNLIRVVKDVRTLSGKISAASDELRGTVKSIADKLSSLPFLSYFAGNAKRKREERDKGRHKK